MHSSLIKYTLRYMLIYIPNLFSMFTKFYSVHTFLPKWVIWVCFLIMMKWQHCSNKTEMRLTNYETRCNTLFSDAAWNVQRLLVPSYWTRTSPRSVIRWTVPILPTHWINQQHHQVAADIPRTQHNNATFYFYGETGQQGEQMTGNQYFILYPIVSAIQNSFGSCRKLFKTDLFASYCAISSAVEMFHDSALYTFTNDVD